MSWCNWCNWCSKEYTDIDEIDKIDDKIYPSQGLFVELTNDHLIVIIDGMYTLEVKLFDCNLSKIPNKVLKELNRKYRSYKVVCLWMDIGTFGKHYSNSFLKNRLAKVYIIDEEEEEDEEEEDIKIKKIDLAKIINLI